MRYEMSRDNMKPGRDFALVGFIFGVILLATHITLHGERKETKSIDGVLRRVGIDGNTNGNLTEDLSSEVRALVFGECKFCNGTIPCEHPRTFCHRGRCVLSSPPAARQSSLFYCFPNLKTCRVCTKDAQCRYGKCIRGRCAKNEQVSKYKCTPRLETTCKSCSAGSQCRSGRCYFNRCMPTGAGTEFKKALRLCFPNNKECAICTASKQCRSGLCYKGRCTENSSASAREVSIKKCARLAALRDCATCTTSSQCASERCFKGICISSARSYLLCRRVANAQLPAPGPAPAPAPNGNTNTRNREFCASCTADNQCTSGRCELGVCQRRTSHSRRSAVTAAMCKMSNLRCAPCDACPTGSICLARICLSTGNLRNEARACMNGGTRCAACFSTSNCNRGLVCYNQYCVPDTTSHRSRLQAVQRCSGRAPRCTPCASHFECADNFCRRGRCGRCNLRITRSVRLCGRCDSTYDCAPGLSCSSRVCLDPRNRQQSESFCFPEVGECGMCRYDDDCDGTNSCVYGRCIKPDATSMSSSIAKCFDAKNYPNSKVCPVRRVG